MEIGSFCSLLYTGVTTEHMQWILGEDGSPVRLSCCLLTGSLHSRPPLPTLSSLFFRLPPPSPLAPFQKPYLAFQAFLPCPYFTFKKRFFSLCSLVTKLDHVSPSLPTLFNQPRCIFLVAFPFSPSSLPFPSLSINHFRTFFWRACFAKERQPVSDALQIAWRRALRCIAEASHRTLPPALSRPYARSGRNVRNVTFASVASPKLKERRN